MSTTTSAARRHGLPFDPVAGDQPRSREESSIRQPSEKISDTPELSLRVAPFHLATVKFPIDQVRPEWENGSNRELNEPHCRRLCQIFEDHLDRTDPAHRLRLACHQDDVDRMKKYLQERGESVAAEGRQGPWMSFMEWEKVNARPAVLLAGHHRVKALEALLKKRGRDEQDSGDRWWICDIYDQGGSPSVLWPV